MANPLNLFTRIGDKAGSVGVLISAIGCAMCFPALASLGAAFGLGFLSQWEGLFITTLLPLFAGLALLVNALGWLNHRQWRRTALGGAVGCSISAWPSCLGCRYGISCRPLIAVVGRMPVRRRQTSEPDKRRSNE